AKEGAGVADFFNGHVAAQRGLFLIGCQHLAEALDAGGGEGTDWAGGNSVDACTFWAEAACEVANTCLKTGLGHTHYVVVGHGALGAQVAQGKDAAITALHQWASGLGQGNQAIGADVVGDLEAFTGGDFGEVAIELITGCISNRMEDAVMAAPLLAHLLEHLEVSL